MKNSPALQFKENGLNIVHAGLAGFLAQAASNPSQGAPPQVPFWANPNQFFIFIIIAMVIFLFWSSNRAKRKEQKTRDDMLKNMKRGDRVMTIGGILGTVVDVRDTDVVLKVDESSNTKIKFTRDAVKRVVTEDETSPQTK
jgi:preprotein translocase subunit YajC